MHGNDLGETGSRQLAETMQLVDRGIVSATKCKVRDSKASEDAKMGGELEALNRAVTRQSILTGSD